jgi:hypothetical protein
MSGQAKSESRGSFSICAIELLSQFAVSLNELAQATSPSSVEHDRNERNGMKTEFEGCPGYSAKSMGLYTLIGCAALLAIALRLRYRVNWRGPVDGIAYG